jgi:hypothetical protein
VVIFGGVGGIAGVASNLMLALNRTGGHIHSNSSNCSNSSNLTTVN